MVVRFLAQDKIKFIIRKSELFRVLLAVFLDIAFGMPFLQEGVGNVRCRSLDTFERM